MRARKLSRGVIAAAVLAAAVALSGCGASKTVSHAAASVSNLIDPVAQAATVSASSPGYTMSFQMNMSGASLPGAVAVTGAGSFAPAQRLGSLTMNVNLGSSAVVSALLGSSTLTMQEIVDHDTFYIKLPAAIASMIASNLPGGKAWIELNLASLASSTGIPGLSSLLDNPTTSNPGAMLQYLKAVAGKVTRVGTATVNGVATTEYEATIDLAKYPNLVPSAQRAVAEQAISALEKYTGGASFPTEVFIDSHHLVRRMTMTLSETIPSAGQTNIAMTVNVLHYGPQATPAIPPAGEVMSASSLLGAASSLLGAATGSATTGSASAG